jgi:hypothetical protein
MSTDIELLPLYAELQGHPKLEIIKHYARANVAHATAEKDAEIEALRAEVAEWKRVASAQAELHGEAEARAERLAEAMRMIAAPIRPDGTWNRDREACRQIARDALIGHEQEGKDG